jgi:hypothetical protein
MTFGEAKQIAAVLKTTKPDPVTGTVGERVLWGRYAQRMEELCAAYVRAGWDDVAWREAAGMDPTPHGEF